jgi:hypothetical protein
MHLQRLVTVVSLALQFIPYSTYKSFHPCIILVTGLEIADSVPLSKPEVNRFKKLYYI